MIVRVGILTTSGLRVIRSKGNAAVAILVLGLGLSLLAVGCARFTYDETATPSPDVGPSPILTPTMAGTAPRAEPQDEAPHPTPTVQRPTVLRMDPSVVNLAIGGTHVVQVWLDNVEGLHSIELHIGFHPGYVRIEDADPNAEGVQIDVGAVPVPAQVVRNEADNGAGLIVYHAAQAPGAGVSGSGVVASFVARALAEGGSPLTFSAVNLRDPDGQPLLAPEQVAGLVVIGPGGVLTEPTAAAPAPVSDSPASTTDVYHTVQPGENLFRIALRYGTTVDAIVATNSLLDESSIQAGQVLRIPLGAPAGTVTYVVQPGDTLYSIARRFDTTVDALAARNGIGPSYIIKVGQALIVAP